MKKTSGKVNGGIEKNALMTAQQRKDLSLKMVEAKKIRASLPKVTHEGVLKILDIELSCYVLSTGQRVLSQRGISETFTGNRGGGPFATAEGGAQKSPRFLARKDIKPFISGDLMVRVNSPIEFLPKAGRSAFGYDSALLPEICEAVLDSSRANNKTDSTEYRTAELLIRGFARVGIAALIDEATGYQKDREKDALAKILEAFVAKELQPYLKTFPADYYEQLFRLYGYSYPPQNKKPQWRPMFFGNITNEVVYKRLAPELLPELKKAASKAERKSKLHQWLSSDLGHPKLREHLASIVSILKLSKTPEDFKANVNLIHPIVRSAGQLDLWSSSE